MCQLNIFHFDGLTEREYSCEATGNIKVNRCDSEEAPEALLSIIQRHHTISAMLNTLPFYERIANSNYNKNHPKRNFFVTHPSYQHCRYLFSNNDEKRCLAREYLQTIVYAMSLVLSIRQILSGI